MIQTKKLILTGSTSMCCHNRSMDHRLCSLYKDSWELCSIYLPVCHTIMFIQKQESINQSTSNNIIGCMVDSNCSWWQSLDSICDVNQNGNFLRDLSYSLVLCTCTCVHSWWYVVVCLMKYAHSFHNEGDRTQLTFGDLSE